MKVLFLDCDGVLNTSSFRNNLTRDLDQLPDSVPSSSQIRGVIDRFSPDCVQQLARIIQTTGAKIVVSSTWKFSGIDSNSHFGNALTDSGDTGIIQQAVIDRTPNGDSRKDEIMSWLQDHPVQDFVVLDDLDLDFDDNHFVKTDDNFGLTKAKADAVIARLVV